MKLDLSKLQNVRHLSGGKTTAQCPVCAADGGDAKGEHLIIYPDGKFGCVVCPKDKAHNKAVLQLVGAHGQGGGGPTCRLTVRPVRVEESRVLLKVGRLGRVKPSPNEKRVGSTVSGPTVISPHRDAEQAEEPADKHGGFVAPRLPPGFSKANLRKFLETTAPVA